MPKLGFSHVLATALAIAIVFLPVARTRAFARVLAAVDALAARMPLAAGLCALISFVGSATVAMTVMWPEPRIHDEFSNLLAADTFALGRVTNPQHPFWQHFESFHIFHEPTYASKYPPAKGLMLGFGQWLTGEPLVGVWLGGAVMCAAICWMLYAWTTPRWALLGGLAATAEVGVATYWTQSYWGAPVVTGAAAIVYGAAARLPDSGRARDAALLALGLVVLANGRPFEGALAALPPVAYVAYRTLRRPPPSPYRTFAPAAAIIAAGIALMAAYNHAVAGSWWLPPYLHHEQLYAVQPPLRWLDRWATPPVYRHRELRRFWAGLTPEEKAERAQAEALIEQRRADALRNASSKSPPAAPAPAQATSAPASEKPAASGTVGAPAIGAARAEAGSAAADSVRPAQPQPPPRNPKPWRIGSVSIESVDELRAFFLGRVLVLPFLLGVLAIRSSRVALAAAGVFLGIVALTATNYFQVHYTAPAAAPLFALCAVGLQRLETFEWRGLPIGIALCVAILICVAGNVALDASRVPDIHTSFGTDVFRTNRAALLEKLEKAPGRDLVIVQYGPEHDVHREWVYNRADIDASDVVWARDMGTDRNRDLIRYFSGRTVWLLREGFLDETDGLTAYAE